MVSSTSGSTTRLVEGSPPLRAVLGMPGRATQWLLPVAEFPFRPIFGRDVFVSYAHANAKYAESLIVTVQKEYEKEHGRKLSVY